MPCEHQYSAALIAAFLKLEASRVRWPDKGQKSSLVGMINVTFALMSEQRRYLACQRVDNMQTNTVGLYFPRSDLPVHLLYFAMTSGCPRLQLKPLHSINLQKQQLLGPTFRSRFRYVR
jgi:hypothetical protein